MAGRGIPGAQKPGPSSGQRHSPNLDATAGKVGEGQTPWPLYPLQYLWRPTCACTCPKESRLGSVPVSTAEQVTGTQWVREITRKWGAEILRQKNHCQFSLPGGQLGQGGQSTDKNSLQYCPCLSHGAESHILCPVKSGTKLLPTTLKSGSASFGFLPCRFLRKGKKPRLNFTNMPEVLFLPPS